MKTQYRIVSDHNDDVLQYKRVYDLLFFKITKWHKIACVNMYIGIISEHTRYITSRTLMYENIYTRLHEEKIMTIDAFVNRFTDINDYFKWRDEIKKTYL